MLNPMAWYEDWFGSDAYELVYSNRDEDEAENLIDLIVDATAPEPGASILDVGCGRGRHARALARRGYRVTGIDLSATALDEARTKAEAEGLDIRFEQADMREPYCAACMDGAVNLFTTFGYFEEDADNQQALTAIATALRPGGWFVQDFLNVPHTIETLVPDDTRQEDGTTIRQHRWIEDGRINKEITLGQNGHQTTYRESVRLFTYYDFVHMYEQTGLTIERAFGTYEGDLYTPDSPRLILYARKASTPDTSTN